MPRIKTRRRSALAYGLPAGAETGAVEDRGGRGGFVPADLRAIGSAGVGSQLRPMPRSQRQSGEPQRRRNRQVGMDGVLSRPVAPRLGQTRRQRRPKQKRNLALHRGPGRSPRLPTIPHARRRPQRRRPLQRRPPPHHPMAGLQQHLLRSLRQPRRPSQRSDRYAGFVLGESK